jgi:hypothetical protein
MSRIADLEMPLAELTLCANRRHSSANVALMLDAVTVAATSAKT